MKNILLPIFIIILFASACNSANQKEIDKQDSIQEAAAADSMLKSALIADSLLLDSLKKDSL